MGATLRCCLINCFFVYEYTCRELGALARPAVPLDGLLPASRYISHSPLTFVEALDRRMLLCQACLSSEKDVNGTTARYVLRCQKSLFLPSLVVHFGSFASLRGCPSSFHALCAGWIDEVWHFVLVFSPQLRISANWRPRGKVASTQLGPPLSAWRRAAAAFLLVDTRCAWPHRRLNCHFGSAGSRALFSRFSRASTWSRPERR